MSQSREKAKRRAQRAAAQRAEKKALVEVEEISRFDSLSFMQKLRRADTHISDLEASIATWRRDGYRVFEESDDQRIVTMYAQLLRPVPESISLFIGDAAQCILNALDHLAFAVASAHPDGLTDKEEEDSAFPIQRQAPAARKDGSIPTNLRTAKWHPCALAFVQIMQPYFGSEGLDQHPLWMLRDLANRDKHRRVTTTAFSHAIHEFTMGNGYLDNLQLFGGREITAERVPLMAYSRRNYGDIKIRHSLEIRFAEGPLVAGREVVPTLRALAEYVEDVPVARLCRFL